MWFYSQIIIVKINKYILTIFTFYNYYYTRRILYVCVTGKMFNIYTRYVITFIKQKKKNAII